ncbi:MAG: tetratricopeptide repeat protein [Bacteroidota bacterium]
MNTLSSLRNPGWTCLFLLSFLLLSLDSNGQLAKQQEAQIDSLQLVIREAEHDSVRILTLEKLAKIYDPSNEEEYLSLTQRIIDQCRDILHDQGSIISDEEKRFFKKHMAIAYMSLGRNLYGKGAFDEAIIQHTKSLSLFEELGDKRGISSASMNIASCEMDKGDPAKAIEIYKESLILFEELGRKSAVSQTLSRISSAYMLLNQPDLALEYIDRGLIVDEEIEKSRSLAIHYNQKGMIHTHLGENTEAIEAFQEQLEVAKEIGDKELWSHGLLNIGNIHGTQGNRVKSIEYFKKAQILFAELGDYRSSGKILNNIGLDHLNEGDTDIALEYFKQSYQIFEEANDTLGIGLPLGNIGAAYHKMGMYGKAINTFLESLKISEIEGNAPMIVLYLNSIGSCYKDTGDFELALTYLYRGLNLAEQSDDKPGEAYSSILIGQIHLLKKAYVEAIQHSNRAFSLSNEMGNWDDIQSSSKILYESHKALGNHTKALSMYEANISVRDSLNSEENQKATIQFEFERKALADSLEFVQERAATEAAYQAKTTRQNYGMLGGLALVIIVFVLFWYRQKLRNERKEYELQRERERREQLLELNQLKSRFFANISHELRTPLALILGPLSHILDQPEAWEKTSVQKQLTLMQRNGKSLMHLIEEMLDLSKLEAHQLELEEEETELKKIVEQIFLAFDSQFNNQDLSSSLDIQTQEGLHLMLDRGKLEKVLNNYLSNAVKFTPKKGKIKVSVSEQEDQIQFKVEDSGPGIHPDDLPYVFDRFYQAKYGDAYQQGGTGIGLGLVREIAHLMEGRAYVESKVGEGSTFYFEIPKKMATTSQTPILYPEFLQEVELEPIHSIGTDFTILVVEDNPDMRQFIHGLLEPRYSRILLAQNGAEALKILTAHGRDIHLIISDIMMPEVDGLSLLREVKAHAEWQHIPMIMLTALATERDKLTALTIGVDDYVTKPFSIQELTARVQNLLYNAHQRKSWKESAEYQEEAQAEKEENRLSVLDQEWIGQVEDLVKASLTEKRISVEELAEAVHLSPRQFRRKLKALTGFSPIKFIKEVQLQLARRELEDGKIISLSDVAFKFGFEHQQTFSTVFKAKFGKAPSEYMRANFR